MCGIAGKIDFAGRIDDRLIHRMCDAIVHRGPDSRGVFADDGVALGIQRLAIIDVAGGDQPIFNEDRSLAVVMNGEIYNHVELRDRLIAKGHAFSSHADTEVLVHLYEEHGAEMVTHLRGMFAFAIWDRRARTLFCARDRVGKKPFYWAQTGSRVWFGSEVMALLADPEIDRAVDPESILDYLAYRYVPHPLSGFRAIRKLPPASTLTVTEHGARVERYWKLEYVPKLEGVPIEELEDRLWAELKEATRIRLMSEVPLGAFLSGGIDSSAVVAAMAEQSAEPVKTFSIGFADEAFDELPYARLVARQFGTDHHEYRVEPHALEIMPTMARHYGEPYADPSSIPSFYLAQLTSRSVKVALNGDGGDESFAGYDRYLDAHLAPHLTRLPRRLGAAAPAAAALLGRGGAHSGLRTKAERLAALLAMKPAERYATAVSAFDAVRRRRLLAPDFAASVAHRRPETFAIDAWEASSATDPVELMMATDVETYLPGDLLAKIDIASMAYSVEARSPFLDHRLMEFAASLAPALKLADGDGKLLLKRMLRRVLPPEILDRPKRGFAVPLARWFREELRDLPRDVLLDPEALGRGYFRRSEVEELIREHRDAVADHSLRLWTLLQLEMWHRHVVDAPPSPVAAISG
ncbi:MAG TPA: asparagine synthase (glutamine-hydrolyzing), partial [Gaiellaceae bacterium]|nr:asparagine synthase (glutamine-hydrolyzing) [Gaiellaceae bacterium]